MKKTKCPFVIILFFCMDIFSFEWPQKGAVTTEMFSSYFGQLRGEEISPSLVFNGDDDEVFSSDDGFVTVVISEYFDDTVFFPSTLGCAAIIAHKNNLLTVYGNINSATISDQMRGSKTISQGVPIGRIGGSAWSGDSNGLEFQVVDTRNNTSINPRILMPRAQGKESPLWAAGAVLQNRSGRLYKIAEQTTLPQGFYRIYYRRQSVATPYKTRLAVNGNVADEISFDILRQDGSLLCASGRKNYPRDILYPNDELILIGEATFTPGKNALNLSLEDIFGKETTASYFITNY